MAKYCPITNEKVLYMECLDCDEKACAFKEVRTDKEDPSEGSTFRCLVVGTRTFGDYLYMERKLDLLLRNFEKVEIISGGSSGADILAKHYAEEKGHSYREFPANWERNGKAAGPIRNEEMQQYIAKFQKKGCVAFWDGRSKGTANSIELARMYGNPIRIVRYDKKEKELQ